MSQGKAQCVNTGRKHKTGKVPFLNHFTTEKKLQTMCLHLNFQIYMPFFNIITNIYINLPEKKKISIKQLNSNMFTLPFCVFNLH